MSALRKIRIEKGLHIKEVAEVVKIPVPTLYDVESGRKGIIAWKAQILASFLKEPVETLFNPTYYTVKHNSISTSQ